MQLTVKKQQLCSGEDIMKYPASYQVVFDQWERQDIHVVQVDWTSGLRRQIGGRVEYKGALCYAKLAIAAHRDLDEPEMLNGMRREVWWSRAIQRLRERDPAFSFTSPRILLTNVNQQPFRDVVAWVVMEYNYGAPIVDWEPERTDRHMTDTEQARFDDLLDAVINSLFALEQVHPQTLVDLGLPPLPAPPHGMRIWEERGMLDRATAVLGNGAFEIKNFWRSPDGQLVIMDNEFAGWYPKGDHLSYLYHRLYCNTVRPDLAKRVLRRYMEEAIFRGDLIHKPLAEREFLENFARILRPRLLSGWLNDTRRRKLPPWHKKQRLRYGLLWYLMRGQYEKLVT